MFRDKGIKQKCVEPRSYGTHNST